jgi:hypothetical protein
MRWVEVGEVRPSNGAVCSFPNADLYFEREGGKTVARNGDLVKARIVRL